MHTFDHRLLQKLYIPPESSHKGQNGKLLLIGGSHLFHAASLWALTIASRIVDMVFYSSVPENNEIVQEAKKEFRDGIVVKRESLDDYAEEADCILIGPGMVRSEKFKVTRLTSSDQENEGLRPEVNSLQEINRVTDEGEQTYWLTKYILGKYPHKKFVLDAGALQMMDLEWLVGLQGNVVVTPHPKEFTTLFKGNMNYEVRSMKDEVNNMAKKYNCTVLLKGREDIVCSSTECVTIAGGNVGMTKGGTGDVLAGLVAALACKNDLFLSAMAGSYFNKKAGESLSQTMGIYFNASDLALEIPKVMASEL